jgi:hypothetical protein
VVLVLLDVIERARVLRADMVMYVAALIDHAGTLGGGIWASTTVLPQPPLQAPAALLRALPALLRALAALLRALAALAALAARPTTIHQKMVRR